MSQLTESLVTIFSAIIGVAILSVLVSRQSNTAGVLSAFGQTFANALSAATAPVTGKASAPNVGGGGNAWGPIYNGMGSFNIPSL